MNTLTAAQLYKVILHIYFVLFCVTAQAQSSNYLFHHLGVKEGLSHGNVWNICQDRRGFLWMASHNCIQRYDGFRFINFFPGKYPQFPSGIIHGMELDSKNRLWVLTGISTLGYLDIDNFTYHAVKVVLPQEYNNAHAAALQLNKAGIITLIYPGRGYITHNEATNEVAAKYNPFNFPSGWEPRHLWQDDELNYWAASANGIIKFNTKKKLLSYSGHNQENDPAIKAFASIANTTYIYRDNDDRYWIGSWEPGLKIKSYNSKNGEILSWENVIGKSINGGYYECWGIRQLKDGSLWANGPGIFTKLDYEKHTSTPVVPNAAGEYSIRYEEVYNLFEDREKSIWTCTDKGLFRFNPTAHLFHSVNNRLPGDNKIYDDDVTGILETTDGEILVSTWGRGILSYDKDFNPVVSKYINRNNTPEALVWCMIQTRNGDIWRGGQDGVLFVYDAKKQTTTKFTPVAINGRTIRQLAEDKEGNVWLGTHAGQLVKWNKTDKQFSLQHQHKATITRLIIDNNNNVWSCTDNDGVYCTNATTGALKAHYTANGSTGKKILSNGATDILQYNDSTIIIASNGLNILNTRTGLFRYWDEGDNIINIVKDQKGIIWLSTNSGIISRDIANEKMYVTYDARDGVNNFDFSVASAYRLKDGRIILGTSNDVLVFDPAKVMNLSFKMPDIQVAGIAVMNNWLPVDSVLRLKQLTIGYDENAVVIRLTNNNYQNLIVFHYMLEGIDKAWKQVSPDGEISLNYLPPGKYIFKATNKDSNGDHGKIISITIMVRSPFYKTWWFYGLMILFVTALFFWIDNERMKRREALQKMRSNIAGNLHKEVNKALNNINVLSEMARLKADKDIEKSKEFIEQIHNKSQHMIITMDDMLWSIDPANDSMVKTVNRMQEFIAAANTVNNSNISMHVDDQVKKLDTNMELRYELLSLFKHIISCTSAAGINEGSINMSAEKKQLTFSVQCNGAEDQQRLQALLNNKSGNVLWDKIEITSDKIINLTLQIS